MKKEEKGLVEANNGFWGKIKSFFSKIFSVKTTEKNDAKASQIDIANELQESDTSTAKQKLPEFVLEYKQDIVAENQRLLKIKNDFDNYLIDEKDIDIKDRQKIDKMYDVQLSGLATEYKNYEKMLEQLN